MLLSRALEENDRGNVTGAMALYRQAIEVYPDYQRAHVLLASLEAIAQALKRCASREHDGRVVVK